MPTLSRGRLGKRHELARFFKDRPDTVATGAPVRPFAGGVPVADGFHRTTISILSDGAVLQKSDWHRDTTRPDFKSYESKVITGSWQTAAPTPTAGTKTSETIALQAKRIETLRAKGWTEEPVKVKG